MSTTIGTILLSYDVNKDHNAVKSTLKAKGYNETWNYGSGPSYTLPNTTLWHSSKSSDQAIADIKNVCNTLRVTLEKAVAVRATDFAGV